MEEFQGWLTNRLLSLELDDSFITDYINGILTGDESQSEKDEALQGILCGIMVSCLCACMSCIRVKFPIPDITKFHIDVFLMKTCVI